MGDKEKAIEELKKQRQLARDRIGPEGVKKLEKMAADLQKNKNMTIAGNTLSDGMVPYDKKAALEAFQLFLKNHGDPAEFERRLREMIAKKSH
ncbi:MAG: hypothetical protein KGL10_09970 [Alphaproteobacteria bacterium]|nr:hypothetical protein [Alphaproteobacteria bacterium]MDE2337626.1 hypothetical protein [Alphaproteobacteria bacterium]